MIHEMKKEFSSFKPGRVSLKDKLLKAASDENSIGNWTAAKEKSCYICNGYRDTSARYLDTFFYLYENDSEFVSKVKNGKGFCIPHFGDLCNAAGSKLSEREQKEFFDMMFPLMERNMERLFEDVAWMVEKFDYVNKDADWKNSKDAIQRGMQKLKGGYPADGPYKLNK